jgi:hypothetical protein
LGVVGRVMLSAARHGFLEETTLEIPSKVGQILIRITQAGA